MFKVGVLPYKVFTLQGLKRSIDKAAHWVI